MGGDRYSPKKLEPSCSLQLVQAPALSRVRPSASRGCSECFRPPGLKGVSGLSWCSPRIAPCPCCTPQGGLRNTWRPSTPSLRGSRRLLYSLYTKHQREGSGKDVRVTSEFRTTAASEHASSITDGAEGQRAVRPLVQHRGETPSPMWAGFAERTLCGSFYQKYVLNGASRHVLSTALRFPDMGPAHHHDPPGWEKRARPLKGRAQSAVEGS